MIALLGLAMNPAAWAAVAVAGLIGWHAGFAAVPKVDPEVIKRDAIEARDTHWKLELANEAAVHENRIAAALEAAQAEPPVSAVPAERLRQCQSSTSCRDRKNSR